MRTCHPKTSLNPLQNGSGFGSSPCPFPSLSYTRPTGGGGADGRRLLVRRSFAHESWFMARQFIIAGWWWREAEDVGRGSGGSRPLPSVDAEPQSVGCTVIGQGAYLGQMAQYSECRGRIRTVLYSHSDPRVECGTDLAWKTGARQGGSAAVWYLGIDSVSVCKTQVDAGGLRWNRTLGMGHHHRHKVVDTTDADFDVQASQGRSHRQARGGVRLRT